jgi:hypothetical protein
MGVEVTIEGLPELNAKWAQVQREMMRDIVAGTTRALREGSRAAKRAAPVKTGELQRSIDPRINSVSSTLVEGELVATAPHALFVSEGTRQHFIRPSRRDVLRFVVDGRAVFTRLVLHPGTKPNDFFEGVGRQVLSSTMDREVDSAVERACAEMNQ